MSGIREQLCFHSPRRILEAEVSGAGGSVGHRQHLATACSATDRAFVPGVFTTAMPACVAFRTATNHVVGWLMPIYRKGVALAHRFDLYGH